MGKGLNSSERQEIGFRPVEESDFSTLTIWLAEPHVCRFYQKMPVKLEQVATEYGPFVRGEEPTICHIAVIAGAPFGGDGAPPSKAVRNLGLHECAALISTVQTDTDY